MTVFMWPERDPMRGTWFGSEELKGWVVAKMIQHRAQDELALGFYQEAELSAPSGYRGCLIGCTLPYRRDNRDDVLSGRTRFLEAWYLLPDGEMVSAGDALSDYHEDVEMLYGIPAEVAMLLDRTFENCPTFEASAVFAVESLQSIPVGVLYPARGAADLLSASYDCDPDVDAVLEFLRTAGVPA